MLAESDRTHSMSTKTKEDGEERESVESLPSSEVHSPTDINDERLLPRMDPAVAGEFFPSILNGTVAPADERYLDNSVSHYTSSFQARPQAEYFDFDDKFKYKPGSGSSDRHDGYLENELEESEANGNESDMSTPEDLEIMINICKIAFNDMINEIDRVLLTEPNEDRVSEASLIANDNLWQIMQLLNDTLENSKMLRSETSFLETVKEDNKETINEDPCAVLPNFGVVLIKSPTSISQLWDEYTKKPSEWPVTDLLSFILQQQGSQHVSLVVKRQTSIQQLESQLGSSWRNFDKNFSRQINRRKKIWRAIEEGLKDGLSLEECFQILESHVKERGSGLSWYYNGVPFKLIDKRLPTPP